MLKHKGLRPPAPSKSKHPHVTSLGGHKIYGRSRGGLVSQHRLQDQDQQHSQTERRAFDALVLSEQVLRAVINQGENEEVVHSSNHADAMGLPELRDSESFLTWFSVVPN